MRVTSETIDAVKIVELEGDLDARTAPGTEQTILELAEEGGRTLLSMKQVKSMSSAGLRMLLVLYRRLGGHEGRIALVGLPSHLRETMDATGFLEHFLIYAHRDDAWPEFAGAAIQTHELCVGTY